MSTSEAPAMTQAAIRKLVTDSVTTALEAQAANMANTDNTTRPREAHVARQWKSLHAKEEECSSRPERSHGGCSRSLTGVKSYLQKYVEQPCPKFDDKQGTIFNANKKIMLIALRRSDVYVLDMSSLTPNEAYFFSKASESVDSL
ncbi:hypothetical protein Tco_0800143 [Tanacetum coccineum]|uniref:Uncharacterized protein n=1 Tax=Tanacetum coccineum TaxID=301880 RepID=A0ABQ4ZW18_9ASTR